MDTQGDAMVLNDCASMMTRGYWINVIVAQLPALHGLYVHDPTDQSLCKDAANLSRNFLLILNFRKFGRQSL